MRFIPIQWIVTKALKTLDNVEFGTMHLTTPEGKHITARGKQPGPEVNFIIYDWEVVRGLLLRGDIAFGEDYIEGKWDCDDITGLMTFFLMNFAQFEKFAHGSLLSRLLFTLYNRIIKRNNKEGSKRNIAAHYDVGNDFYRLWLDKTMTYSSALYKNGNENLEDAQLAKYHRILERINLPNASLLEIGCGWGGFAEAAVGKQQQVTSLTISPSQHDYAVERLQGNADIRLQDYRDIKGSFDAIVSIEMFEAVGEQYWQTYFKAVADNLKKGGKAIIQTITMGDEFFEAYRNRSDFIRHYVFPGGMLPSLTRFREEAAKAGLKCVDIFTFGEDYSHTLKEWLKRFDAKKQEIIDLGYSEQFIRNWRFYLGTCAAAFAVGRTNVAQIELVHL